MHSSSKALRRAALLTAAHCIAKLIGGYMTNRLALISDAWHLLTDLLSLVLSWIAMKVSNHPPTKWAAFEFQRVGILADLFNNLNLIGISFYILYEAYVRFLNPETLETAKDIHVWCLAEESIALSAHISLDRDISLSQTEPILHDIKHILSGKFNIHHVNIQFELKECSDCHHTAA